jgi:murein DD-endopeptidase MepM/ murein hydrolase activator NlpD
VLLPGTAHAQSAGGTAYTPPTFKLTPATIVAGTPLTLRYRVPSSAKRVRVRVDILPAAGGRPQATLRLGKRPTNRRLKATWTPEIAPGSYVARLRAARASLTATLQIQAAATGVFPVQGPYSFGGPASRFGAVRDGHMHQGQDIAAAAGTPVVAPRAGVIVWRAYQAAGAGNYLVLHGDDARDYVFMHLQTGSVLVEKEQQVGGGQQLAAVGSTGHSDGPHLHFEIWPDGWYASKTSQPIDPLPDLLAWAG